MIIRYTPKLLFICWLIFFFQGYFPSLSAQVTDRVTTYSIDSLRKQKLLAKQDSTKLRLEFLIGSQKKIDRFSYWDSVLKDSRALNLTLFEALTLDKIGMIYLKKRNREEAKKYFDKSLSYMELHGYKKESMGVIRHQAMLYSDQVDRTRALDLYYKGLKIAEQLKDEKSTIDFYSYIGLYYFLSRDIKRAMKFHFDCLKRSTELDYHSGIASALVDIGSDYHALADHKKSSEYYLKSQKYAEEFGTSMEAAQIYNSVSSGYDMMKEYDSAYKYAYRSYEICLLNKDRRNEASSRLGLAGFLYRSGKHKEALNMTLETYELIKEIGFTTQMPAVLLQLKMYYEEQKDYKNALKYHEKHILVRDSLSSEEIRKEALEKEFTYKLEKKEDEKKLVEQKNEIQSLQLSQHKYFLLGLGVLSFIGLIVAYLISRHRKLKFRQQNIELEQKLLRSQMNPHFIFNSLNSVQQFIMSGKNQLAETYLSKFSKLIRELLESNMRENISVREETKILQGYLEMESLRFSHSFSFSIEVDPALDQDHLHIPHMMIQPFIENAIWHGLLKKEGERILTVRFMPHSSETIKCIVDDNGVGRQKSSGNEITFKKKSLALSFILQRIELMKTVLKVDCSLEIIDKTDTAGNSLGTKVIIVLPLKK